MLRTIMMAGLFALTCALFATPAQAEDAIEVATSTDTAVDAAEVDEEQFVALHGRRGGKGVKGRGDRGGDGKGRCAGKKRGGRGPSAGRGPGGRRGPQARRGGGGPRGPRARGGRPGGRRGR